MELEAGKCLISEAPGYVRRSLEDFYNFVKERAARENASLGGDFPAACGGLWAEDILTILLNYPDRDYYYGRCEIALSFSGEEELIEIAVVSRPYHNEGRYEILRTIGALAMIFMDRDIGYEEARAFIGELCGGDLRNDENPVGWQSLGSLRAYIVAEDQDSDMVALEIHYGKR